MTAFRIEGAEGRPLTARLDLPGTEPRAYALFVHCLPSGTGSAAEVVTRALTAAGVGVLRIACDRPGEFTTERGFGATVADLVAAARRLRRRYAAPTLLVGHSHGGTALLAAAHRLADVRAVVTIGAPSGPPHADLSDRIARLGAALLVLHSPVDAEVGIEHAREIFEAARHPRSFLALDGADHHLTGTADAAFAASMLTAWAVRYLPAPAAAEPEEGRVVVAESGAGPYGQHLTAGHHALTADEPPPAGAGSGPSPYDYLLAGLGACTSMTVRMYADRKGWPLDGVTVSLRHSRVHAADCADCETTSGRIDRIDRVIRIDGGDLDDEQRARLLEIADRCPVHRTLRSETVIHTEAAPPRA